MMTQEKHHKEERYVKASTYISEADFQTIDELRGDITVSLWLRRAAKKAIAEQTKGNSEKEGVGASMSLPTK